MSLVFRARRPLNALGGAVAVGLVALVALHSTATVQIVSKAAGIPKQAQGIGGFVNGANALVTPALVMMAAIAPLGLLAGGVITMFGGRRGMAMVATCLGVLLLVGSAKALIA